MRDSERILWDIHSHVLPGIDDGARDWDTTMAMIRKAADSGIGTIVATPHYLPWIEPIPIPKVRELCKEAESRFESLYRESVNILPGGELYYHSQLVDELEAGRVPTLNGTGAVLVEFSTAISFSELIKGVTELDSAGYTVIVAHIERYDCLRAKNDGAERLRDSGALLQSNISEIGGGFFDGTTRWLKGLYRHEIISFTASDMHNLKRRPPISEKDLDNLRRTVPEYYFGQLMCENAELYLID